MLSDNYIPPSADEIVISWFPRVDIKNAADTTLQHFIDVVAGRCKSQVAQTIMQLREIDKQSENDKYRCIKMQLPCVTPSCRCTPGGSHASHSSANGVVCIDIDAADNPQFAPEDWGEVRATLGGAPWVYLSALSAGGRGVFLLVATDPRQDFRVRFDALQVFFKKFGITIDRACCNVNRLRFVSYDPQAIVKCPQTYFKAVLPAVNVKNDKKYYQACKRGNKPIFGDDFDRVRAAVRVWDRKKIALSDYSDWVNIGASLKDLPDGEDQFITVSSHSEKFNREVCLAKYRNECCKLTRLNAGSFINYCREYGITDAEINEEWRKGRK